MRCGTGTEAVNKESQITLCVSTCLLLFDSTPCPYPGASSDPTGTFPKHPFRLGLDESVLSFFSKSSVSPSDTPPFSSVPGSFVSVRRLACVRRTSEEEDLRVSGHERLRWT